MTWAKGCLNSSWNRFVQDRGPYKKSSELSQACWPVSLTYRRATERSLVPVKLSPGIYKAHLVSAAHPKVCAYSAALRDSTYR